MERELLATGAALTLGSSSAICAHNLAALGTKVGFVSKVGNDPFGRAALDRLAAGGVEVPSVRKSMGKTLTGGTVVLPYLQQRYIFTYPGTMFEMQYSDIDLGYLRSARHLHVSSFFLHRSLRPRMLDLYRQAKDAGLSTPLDTNDDPDDKWPGDVLELLRYVDIFFPSDREAKKLTGTSDLSQALNDLASRVKIVALKRGSSAAICRSGDQQYSLVPPTVQSVDNVGAGVLDFMYLRGGNLEDCLALANIVAAYSTTKEGGTESFVNRAGMVNFSRQHWSSRTLSMFPINV